MSYSLTVGPSDQIPFTISLSDLFAFRSFAEMAAAVACVRLDPSPASDDKTSFNIDLPPLSAPAVQLAKNFTSLAQLTSKLCRTRELEATPFTRVVDEASLRQVVLPTIPMKPQDVNRDVCLTI